MARHTRLHWAPAAAILILCAAFAWFSPRSTRDMLPLSAEGGDVRALTVSGDGTLRAFALPASGLLSSALADSACVRLPPALPGPLTGDICVSAGGMCAWITPRGAFLSPADGDSGCYMILGSGPALYQKIQDLIPQNA